MVSANIYPIQDESPFVEREENYEIYREIYGDPIYDVYEDDVCVIDFVFSEDFFANFVCAKIGQDEIRAKFGRDKIRANPVQDELRANFGESQKIRFYENFGFEDKYWKISATKNLFKIRGRIFSNPERMMQISIWNISKYLVIYFISYINLDNYLLFIFSIF